MNEAEIKSKVLERYGALKGSRNPEIKRVEVESIATYGLSAYLVAVDGVNEDDSVIDEICYVDRFGRVKIFDTTPQLLDYIESSGSFRSWIFSGSGVSAIAFAVALMAVIGLATRPERNKDLETVLGHILTLAAGFFFGNQANSKH